MVKSSPATQDTRHKNKVHQHPTTDTLTIILNKKIYYLDLSCNYTMQGFLINCTCAVVVSVQFHFKKCKDVNVEC